MPLHLDEHTLRERVTNLTSLYERGRQRLVALNASAAATGDAAKAARELSAVLGDVKAAEPLLRELVTVWEASPQSLRNRLSPDVERLRQSAAQCLALVSSTERDFTQQRDKVTSRLDDGATRNRAVRAYADAMRQ